jgi:hypothetical protein
MIIVAATGCDKLNTPTGPNEEITETNLMPLVAGHSLTYDAYVVDTVTTNYGTLTTPPPAANNAVKKTGSDYTVIATYKGPVTKGEKTNAYLLIDSTFITGLPYPIVDTQYVAVDNGNISMFLLNKWVLAFDRSKGTNKQYEIGTGIEPSSGTTVTIKGTISKDSANTQAAKYIAYRLELATTVSGVTIGYNYFWFSNNVGTVQIYIPAFEHPTTKEHTLGSVAKLRSKNF